MTASETVFDTVRERILSGAYPAGALLSEGEVAAELRVSRTPAHEAFRRLEANGLLDLIPRRGAVVVPVGPREAVDVLEVRHALETAAVRRLAADSPEAGAARRLLATRLAESLEEQRAHAEAGEVAAFAVADETFHRAIVTASGNAVSDGLYATLADRQRRMTVGSIGRRTEQLDVLIAEHSALADCVATSDAAKFDRILLAHLHATHRTLIAGLL